jgi:LPXTG-motif cell wall-anchored protein
MFAEFDWGGLIVLGIILLGAGVFTVRRRF